MDTSSHASRWTVPLIQLQIVREALQTDAQQIEARRLQRNLVRTICSMPEARTLHPEEFFVAFKEALTTAADNLNIPHGRERNEVLSRLLSISIEEFFQNRSAADVQPLSDSVRLSAICRRVVGHAQRSSDEE